MVTVASSAHWPKFHCDCDEKLTLVISLFVVASFRQTGNGKT
jgi:hypothetical protein